MNKAKETSRISENHLAVQSNALIHARYKMTALQKKILLMLISKIQPEDQDFKPYRIKARDFLNIADLKSTQVYGKLKKATEGLLSKVFQIEKKTGILQITILSSAEYFKGKGIMELCFDPKLKPYLLQLKEQFTIMPLKQVLSLRSIYAIRIYEMLQQFKSTGFFVTRVEDLKYKLGIEDKYRSYNLFKKNVILQAQKELKDTDMDFYFTEIKKGRKIDRIKFTLLTNPLSNNQADQSDLFGTLTSKFNVSEKQANRILSLVTEKEIHKTLFQIKQVNRDGGVKTNLAAYTVGVFAKKYKL